MLSVFMMDLDFSHGFCREIPLNMQRNTQPRLISTETKFLWRMNQNAVNGTSISDIRFVESYSSGSKRNTRMEIHLTIKVLTLLQTLENSTLQDQFNQQPNLHLQPKKRRNKNQLNLNKKLPQLLNVSQRQPDLINPLTASTTLAKLSPLRKKKSR